MRRLWWWILAFIISAPAFAQVAPITGYCVSGASKAVVSGLGSANYLQGVIPKCTVSVYNTGTFTPATIYSDGSSTPLSNPFTANKTTGQWLFYAASSAKYDVLLTGGVPPNTYVTPVTLTGLGSGGGSSGGLPSGTGLVKVTSGTGGLAVQTDVNPFLTAPGPIGNTTPAPSLATNNQLMTALRPDCTYLPTSYYDGGNIGCQYILAGDGSWVPGVYGISNQIQETVGWGTGAATSGGNLYEAKFTKGIDQIVECADAGGCAAFEQHLSKNGNGDVQAWYLYGGVNGGPQYGSDQANQAMVVAWGENGIPQFTLATQAGATYGYNTLTFSACAIPHNALGAVTSCFPSPGNLIANITQGGPTGQILSSPVGYANAGWVAQVDTSATLPAATAYAWESGINYTPSASPDKPTPMVITSGGGSGLFSVGDTVCVDGSSGGVAPAVITAVSGSTPGAQVVTLPFGYPASSVFIIKGSLTCGLMRWDADAALGNSHYPGIIYVGSIDGHNALFDNVAYNTTGGQLDGIEVGSPLFQASHAYSLNDYVFDGANVEQVTVAGTSGSSAPTWPGSKGGTVTTGPTSPQLQFTNIGLRSNFSVFHAATVLSNSFAKVGNDYKFQSVLTTATDMRFTVGDVLENPNMGYQGTQIFNGGQQCLTADALCEAFSIGSSGMGLSGGSAMLNIYDNNPASMYIDPVTELGTGIDPPQGIKLGGFGTPGLFSNAIFGSMAPRDALITFENAYPGVTDMLFIGVPGFPLITANSVTDNIEILQGGLSVQGSLSAPEGQTSGKLVMVTGGDGASGTQQLELGFLPQADTDFTHASYLGLCDGTAVNGPLCVSNVVRTGSFTALTPNVALNALNFNGVPLTATGSSTNFLAADGAYHAVSGGGGISGLTSGYIPLAGSATTLTGNSHLNDGVTTAATLTATEPIVAPSLISGAPSSGALAALPTGSHGVAGDESSTAGVPAPGVDYIRWDATAHCAKLSVNNGAEACISTGSGSTLSCQPGLGDGLNVIPAGTYLQTNCRNESSNTWTLTSIRCVVDTGSSTCNVTNGAGTSLLTGAITGTSTYATGTQSGTTTIASGDYLKITFVADGTSTQIGIDVSGTN